MKKYIIIGTMLFFVQSSKASDAAPSPCEGSLNCLKKLSLQEADLQQGGAKELVSQAPVEKTVPITVKQPISLSSLKHLRPESLRSKEGVTVVFWDIDGTLVRQKLILNNFTDKSKEGYLNDFFKEGRFVGPDDQRYELVKDVFSADHYPYPGRVWDESLVEGRAPKLIQSLSEMNVINIGLTARSIDISGETHRNLIDLGLNFCKLSWLEDHRDSELGLENGIVYTGNAKKKVEYIPKIISLLQAKLSLSGPFDLYHIDDNGSEISAFTKFSGSANTSISIQPLYYSYFTNYLEGVTKNPQLLFDELNKEFYFKRVLPRNKTNYPKIESGLDGYRDRGEPFQAFIDFLRSFDLAPNILDKIQFNIIQIFIAAEIVPAIQSTTPKDFRVWFEKGGAAVEALKKVSLNLLSRDEAEDLKSRFKEILGLTKS